MIYVNSIKKSQKGRVQVRKDPYGGIFYTDGHSLYDECPGDLLRPIFKDGKLLNVETFSQIRQRLSNQRNDD